tara:strand:- start:33063 stop:34010 length:948 start_codon:yes stop_codon:yes gene_type:complete
LKQRQSGMTLVEVMISLAILSFMAIYTGNAIRNALSSKTRIQKNIDRQSTLRDALKVMERDINLAFQFRDPNVTLYNKAVDERENRLKEKKKKDDKSAPKAKAGNGNFGSTNNSFSEEGPGPEKLEKRPVEILTQFVGEKDKISFSSLSNVRMRADDKVSSVAEIGYFLKNCRRRTSQEKSSACLWRRVDNVLGKDITKGGSETVLLENVEEFSLRYLGPGKEDEWVDTWASNEKGDDLTKGKFPYAVEITLEIADPKAARTSNGKKRTLRMTQVAEIRNPGNIDAPKEGDPNTQNPEGENAPSDNANGGGDFTQ